jgi:tRNA pseudouridine55 synthase
MSTLLTSRSLNGWIVIDKPEGISSHDVVYQVRRYLGIKKIGHAGTLDPLASGVLLLAIGEATKLISYAMETIKEYVFDVTWGEERTTDDREGNVIKYGDKRPISQDIRNILSCFEGSIEQTPPLYSAIKVKGKRSCDRVREGEEIVLTPRAVMIHALHLDEIKSQNVARFSMICGKGTYVRSVARDMGRLLGCYGYVSYLRRTRVGRFSEREALPLKKFLAYSDQSLIIQFIHPMVSALDDIPVVTVGQSAAMRLLQGQSVALDEKNLHEGCSVFCLDQSNVPLGIGVFSCGVLKPKRMFHFN